MELFANGGLPLRQGAHHARTASRPGRTCDGRTTAGLTGRRRSQPNTGDIADATGVPGSDRGCMQPSAQCPGQTTALRILIVDDHDISRAAFRALLRTEGMHVVSDLGAGDDALAAARGLRPDVAIVDVAPRADAAFGMARKLRALPSAPAVILTSSADRALFGPELNGYPFLAKADIHASALRHLAEAGVDGVESPNA